MDNQNQVLKIVEQSFHVSLGAISVATETLQNEQKRQQLVSELSEQLNQRAQEWEEKGEATASEARRFLDELMNQGSQETSSSPQSSPTGTEPADRSQSTQQTEPAGNDVPSRLQALTDEVAMLREEMAQFRS